MGSKDKVHKSVTLLNLLNSRLLLHHTSANCNLHMRILFLVITALSKASKNSLVRIISNCTGIIYNKIGILRFALFISCKLKDGKELFRIPCIHLAAKCYNTCCQFSSKFPGQRVNMLFCLLDKRKLLEALLICNIIFVAV